MCVHANTYTHTQAEQMYSAMFRVHDIPVKDLNYNILAFSYNIMAGV